MFAPLARLAAAVRSRPRALDRTALLLVWILHAAATLTFLPPREILRTSPLQHVDHPVHTHRVHVYRAALAESGWPWGCDPRTAAGLVMTPDSDIGSKPQQVVGLLLRSLSAGAVVRLSLFLVVLTLPLGTFFACRRLRLPADSQAWVLLLLVALTWLRSSYSMYFEIGLVSFVSASFLAPAVLALFLDLLGCPRILDYVGFAAAMTLLLLLHLLGPLIVALPIAACLLIVRRTARQRLALLLVLLLPLVLNAFWLLPFLCFLRATPPPTPPAVLPAVSHLRYTAVSDLLRFTHPSWLMGHAAVVAVAVGGWVVLKRVAGKRAAMCFAAAAVVSLLLKYFGSFVPVLANLQPVRFVVPAYVFFCLPLGLAAAAVLRKAACPPSLAAAAACLVLAAAGPLLGKPDRLPLPAAPDSLHNYVRAATEPSARLLVQSHDGRLRDGYEARALPLWLDREVIGCSFPEVDDPIQFTRDFLLGRNVSEWDPDGLRGALQRWGVSMVFTQTDAARALMAGLTGSKGEPAGKYTAFRLAGESRGRFLIGAGELSTRVNRMELKALRPQEGWIVLRYRYHPAWRCVSGTPVRPYPVPEDPRGLIALRDPRAAETLVFDPWAALSAVWAKPAEGAPESGSP